MNKEKLQIILSRILKYYPDEYYFNLFYLWWYFLLKMHYLLPVIRPKTLNEKMQFLKITQKGEKYTNLADKVLSREYVKNKIGEKYCPEIYYKSSDIESLVEDDIPKIPFIFKVNHDSSGGLIVKDCTKFDIINVKKNREITVSNNRRAQVFRKFAQERFKYNEFYLTRESQYKNIKPMFFFEELLCDSKGSIPNDYKFHCFDGKVLFIYVSIDREGVNNRKIYYPNWVETEFIWAKKGEEYKFDGKGSSKPENLEKMITIAELLSSEFNYVRVDLYNVEGRIYVGELTFQQGSGFEPILPKRFDEYYGSLIKLPHEI
jgi:hypothetical protein